MMKTLINALSRFLTKSLFPFSLRNINGFSVFTERRLLYCFRYFSTDEILTAMIRNRSLTESHSNNIKTHKIAIEISSKNVFHD